MISGTCPKCSGREIIVAQPPEYGHDSMEYPMTVTAEPRWVLWGRNPRYGKGKLLLYVCRSCGYAEWYVEDPESIPIGEQFRTELLEPSEDEEESEPLREEDE